MHILHFYKSYVTHSFGGVEQLIFQLINGMTTQGVSSEILSLGPSKIPTTTDIEGHKAHTAYCNFEVASTGFSLRAFSRFKELAKQADIIHYHYPWPFMDLVHFLTRVKKPTVVTYHSDIIRQKNLLKIYTPLMKAFLNSVDHIVVTSPNYLKSSEVLPQFKNKTSVVPIGLDERGYKEPSKERLEFWKERFSSRFFLFVGMLRYYKGLHYLLNAMKGLDYPLVIVGSGPEEERLKSQAQQAGLKQVHFLGALNDEDKIALLQLCYGFVFPSHVRSEAFGISLLEAAMFGKPLLSCEIGTGTSYINQHRKTGLVVAPENPSALREALIYLWDNPNEVEVMGAAAREHYKKLFTAENMISGYLGVYQKVIKD